MRGVGLIVLHACAVQANGLDDMFVDGLIDNMLGWNADLDDTALGVAVPSAVRVAEGKLMAHGIVPGQLGMLALTAIDASNRGTGMRNVAAMASKLPDETRAVLSSWSKKVVVKAEAIKKAEDMAGITAPMKFFDPLKFASKVSDDETLAYYREAELKHGRVAMFSTLGIIAGEKYSPIFGATEPTPAALQFGKGTEAGSGTFWGAIIIGVTMLELANMNNQAYSTKVDFKNPMQAGDYGFDPLGLKPKDAAKFKTLQDKELNNGRLAMFASMGIIAQEMVTGKKIF